MGTATEEGLYLGGQPFWVHVAGGIHAPLPSGPLFAGSPRARTQCRPSHHGAASRVRLAKPKQPAGPTGQSMPNARSRTKSSQDLRALNVQQVTQGPSMLPAGSTARQSLRLACSSALTVKHVGRCSINTLE